MGHAAQSGTEMRRPEGGLACDRLATRESGMSKSVIGDSPRRREDARFITGRGAYVDDLPFEGLTRAVFVRSTPRPPGRRPACWRC